VNEPGGGGRIIDRNGWVWEHLADAWYCVRSHDGSRIDVPYTWGELVAVFGPVTAA
jgi:hypothetical protein